MTKKIIAFAAAVVIAVSMSVSVFAATTYEDVVMAAKAAGFLSLNIQEPDYFLQERKDCFTSDEYDDMIAYMNIIRDTYIEPFCRGGRYMGETHIFYFDKNPADLTEQEKMTLRLNWIDDKRKYMWYGVINLGEKLNVTVT